MPNSVTLTLAATSGVGAVEGTATLDTAATGSGVIVSLASTGTGDTFQATSGGANLSPAQITIASGQTTGNFWMTPGSGARTLLQSSDFTFQGYISVPNGVYTGLSYGGPGFTHRYQGGNIRFLANGCNAGLTDLVELGLPSGLTSASFTGSTLTPAATLSSTNVTNYWTSNSIWVAGEEGWITGIAWEDSTTSPGYSGSPRLWTVQGVSYPGNFQGLNEQGMTSSVATMSLTNGNPGTVSGWQGLWGFQDPLNVTSYGGVSQRCIMGKVLRNPSWVQSTYAMGPYLYLGGGFASLNNQGGTISPGLFAIASRDVADGVRAPLSPTNWSTAGSGTVTIPFNGQTITTSVSNPPGMVIGNAIGINGDSSNNAYLILSGSGTSWLINQFYSGTGGATGASWTYSNLINGTGNDWTIPNSDIKIVADHRTGMITNDWYASPGSPSAMDRGVRLTNFNSWFDVQHYNISGNLSISTSTPTTITFGTAQNATLLVGCWLSQVAGDSSNGVYQITASTSSTVFTISPTYGGSSSISNATTFIIGQPPNNSESNAANITFLNSKVPIEPPNVWTNPCPSESLSYGTPASYARMSWYDNYAFGGWANGTSKYGLIAVATLVGGWGAYVNSALWSNSAAAEIHVFDPADFGGVEAATKNPWNVQPRTMKAITPELTAIGWQSSAPGGLFYLGVAFDATSSGIFGAPTLWVWVPGLGENQPGRTYDCALLAYTVTN